MDTLSENEVCRRYLEGEILFDLIREFHTSHKYLSKLFADKGIEIRKQGTRKPKRFPDGTLVPATHRECPKCKVVKSKSEFNRCKKNRNGLQSYCIDCRRPVTREYMRKKCATDPEFKERLRINGNRSYHRNKEKNRESNNAKARARHAQNPEKKRRIYLRWRQANKLKLRKYCADRQRNKRQNIPSYRALCNLRCRISNALKAKGIHSKSRHTKDFLGCEFNEFLKHLERQFKPNMSWDNYGRTWHIDHIIPCNSFDLTDLVQQSACFHYTNLQPLWATTAIAREHGDMVSIGNINKNDNFICESRTVDSKL